MKEIYSTLLIVGDDFKADLPHLRRNRIIPIKASEITANNYFITHLCGQRISTILILEAIPKEKLDYIVELILPNIHDVEMITNLEIINYHERN